MFCESVTAKGMMWGRGQTEEKKREERYPKSVCTCQQCRSWSQGILSPKQRSEWGKKGGSCSSTISDTRACACTCSYEPQRAAIIIRMLLSLAHTHKTGEGEECKRIHPIGPSSINRGWKLSAAHHPISGTYAYQSSDERKGGGRATGK